MANIIVSTLGATWEIIAETVGFVNHSKVDFYQNHPDLKSIQKSRENNFGLDEADELWLIATDKQHTDRFNSTDEDLEKIRQWNWLSGGIIKNIRIWILSGVDDIVNVADAEAFHDLTLRVVAYAKQKLKKEGGKLFLSLACGRKTMSADIQDAAYCFGCDAMIHIISNARQVCFDADVSCLNKENVSNIYPLCLGNYKANEILNNCTKLTFQDVDYLKVERSRAFLKEVRERQDESQFFYTSYYLKGNQNGRSNFRVLYTLEPEHIARIQHMRLGVDKDKRNEELELLHRLPKTDLHCHLGGVLDSKDLIDVASCYAEDIENEKAQNEKFREWADGFKQDIRKFKRPKSWKTWQKEVSKHLHVNPCLVNASLLLAFRGQEDLLEAINFGSLLSEQEYIGIGITRYEALGDLQGSALLQTEKSIRRTVQILLEKAERENIVYLEIRCSPFNYVYNGLSGQQVIRFICEELEKKPDIHTSLLLIASRHGKLGKIRHSIKLMREMESDVLFKKYFRGFDLAGDESVCPPAKLRKEFEDILRDCRNITIHAGENAPVENIWEAVYLLNAERVGHGLTLKDNPDLLNKFLERRIGIEMCPSSNFQIVGFHDNYLPNTKKRKIYPLREYLDKELMVCINTDDPGISRTDMTNELLRAARLTENGLTLWEILQLIYNGLQLAFYPYSKKKEMIHDVETKLGQLIRDGQL
jgi:adenosine deaminase